MPRRIGSSSLRDKVDALKRAVDLRDLFMERYPGQFRRSGRWLYGSSPYRRDHHPSFAVNEDVFIDFATGERGDEVDFMRREQGLSFSEAVEALEARAHGVSIAPVRAADMPHFSASPNEPPPAPWQTAMRAEVLRAHDGLFSEQPAAMRALDWLKARGLREDTARGAALGFNPAWRQTALRERDTGQRVSIAPGILIPCEVDGALWAVHVRTLPEITAEADLPKYLYVRGSKASGIYNGDALYPGCTVLIVEGEFDALLAQQELADEAVVITLGSASNKLSRRWAERVKAARIVYSCLDDDEAGQRATGGLNDLLGEQHRALCLPKGKDLTEFVVEHGGNLRAWWLAEIERDAPPPVQLPLL